MKKNYEFLGQFVQTSYTVPPLLIKIMNMQPSLEFHKEIFLSVMMK